MTTVASDKLLAELGKLHPKLIDLSLERIAGLLEKLGAPQRNLPPVIHVAGTNGKGSTTAFMRAMLEASGHSVHTYTSPHLIRFHERIRLAREPGRSSDIEETELVGVIERVMAANDGEPMTFFEMTTAAAFLAFAETPADVVLLEVGLGGRLDATNLVAKPALSVITPISLDHTELLADSVEEIAFEKAGILKAGVTAVAGPQPNKVIDVLEGVADRVGARLLLWGQDFDAYEQNGRLVYQGDDRVLDCRLPELHGRHQIMNAGLAIAALLHADLAHTIPEAAIDQGLAQVRWPARMSRLNGGALAQIAGDMTEIWLDGGHNPAAGAVLGQFLAELEERSPKPTFLIVGMMQRKDVEGFISPFHDLAREVLTVPIRDNPTGALTTGDLADRISRAGLPVCEATSVLDALRQIIAIEPGEKRILICGSLYLAGAVLAFDGHAVV
ncbi:MAG: bifunctional folylpolyglutamate synthase/dihydrofolate synthase [Hyphomicrobiaceae bacterium]